MSIDAAALHALKVGILDAVHALLPGSIGGEVERACVVPGLMIAWDDCECGQLTVHQRAMWPSAQFPNPVEPGRANCAVPYWAVQIVVTLLRCSPQGVDDQAPTCEQLAEAAVVHLHDMEMMQRGTACALTETTFRVDVHTPVASEGACVGSELVVVVAVPNCPDDC
jgi:hypothetical protein